MEKSMIVVNVTTCDANGSKVEALSIDNCVPQQLNSILSLCKKDFVVTVSFREVDIPNVIRPHTQD